MKKRMMAILLGMVVMTGLINGCGNADCGMENTQEIELIETEEASEIISDSEMLENTNTEEGETSSDLINQENTNTENTNSESTSEEAVHQHTFSIEWGVDEGCHWHICACGEKKDKEIHSFGDWIVTKEATETKEGLKYHICTECAYKETSVIPNLKHTHQFSTTWNSNSAYHWYECFCSEKGQVSQHTYSDWKVINEATCTDTGLKELRCTICGYREIAIIGRLGHNYVNDVCTKCKESIADLSINYENVELYFGSEVWQYHNGQFLLKIENLPEEGNVEWESANPSIAEVDDEGNVTIHKYGSTVIYGSISDKKFSCKMNIKKLKVYNAREYTDSRLSEAERILWIEEGDFTMGTGDTRRYKIVALEYDEQGNVVKEEDVTSSLNIVPEVEGAFTVDREKGTITALLNGTNQIDCSSNISVEVASYGLGTSQYRQVLRLKVFTEDKWDYFDSLSSFRGHGETLTAKLGINFNQTVWCWGYGYHETHDGLMITIAEELFYNIPEGDFTWESSDESVVSVLGYYGSSSHAFGSAEIKFVGTGTATLSFKYKGEVLETLVIKVVE